MKYLKFNQVWQQVSLNFIVSGMGIIDDEHINPNMNDKWAINSLRRGSKHWSARGLLVARLSRGRESKYAAAFEQLLKLTSESV